jgi:hypothetical protein
MCGLRRELPLGEAFNEWERAFAKRIPALSEDPESSSASSIFCIFLIPACHLKGHKTTNRQKKSKETLQRKNAKGSVNCRRR